MLLERQDKPIETIKYLETAFTVSDEHHIVHSLGYLKQAIGDYRAEVDYYEKTLHDVKAPVPMLHSIADCYHFLQEYKNCVRILAREILAHPRDKVSWVKLGYALIQLNKPGLFVGFVLISSGFIHNFKLISSKIVIVMHRRPSA